MDSEDQEGAGKHNRYIEIPGFAPILVTRDPHVIRAIATETGAKPGQFDRDTLPTDGIARATGADSLLYANGEAWKRQKKLSTPPMARTTLFQPEQFHEFETTLRHTGRQRLERVRQRLKREAPPLRVRLEPEINAVMLEMLVVNFFGAEVSYDQIRDRYVPAIDAVIEFIVRDTIFHMFGVPLSRLPHFTSKIAQAKRAQTHFEELTDKVLAARKHGSGLWRHFRSEASDDLLRSNIRVFLAGALEATTSYASWAISHLARHSQAQQLVYDEVRDLETYSPQILAEATYLGNVLDETLRLTPSLYFLPRRATSDTWIETTAGLRMYIPAGTHVLLDVWHANRHEDNWGRAVTGYPALDFEPARWQHITSEDRATKDLLHFGFGHGPRFCPGKHLGQLEVGLVVGAFVKLFRFEAPARPNPERAGVSTKPEDGAVVDIYLREVDGQPRRTK